MADESRVEVKSLLASVLGNATLTIAVVAAFALVGFIAGSAAGSIYAQVVEAEYQERWRRGFSSPGDVTSNAAFYSVRGWATHFAAWSGLLVAQTTFLVRRLNGSRAGRGD